MKADTKAPAGAGTKLGARAVAPVGAITTAIAGAKGEREGGES